MTILRNAILLLLFGLTSIAAAESYTIRLQHNTNLRAAASLSARIVVTARSGTTLQVVGKADRWLRINRNGSEVWMASWVGHSRVSGAQPDNINNCCFVDRECHNDHDWVSGYYAYQNKQCPVSAAPAAISQPDDINNCCFVDRRCQSEQDWVKGYWAYQNQQCLAPGHFGNAHGVVIVGGQGFIEQMEDALDVLKRRAPHWYNYTVSGLNRIVQRLESDIPGVDVGAKTFYLDYTDHYPQGYSPWLHISNTAAMLAHEACHVHRHLQGLEAGGYPGEKACLTLEIGVMKEIGVPAFWIAASQHTLDNIDDPAYQWWLPGNY